MIVHEERKLFMSRKNKYRSWWRLLHDCVTCHVWAFLSLLFIQRALIYKIKEVKF